MRKYYHRKLIISGDVVELFEYDRPVIVDHLGLRPSGRSKSATEEQKLINRYKTMVKARGVLRRVINANAYQWYDERGSPYKPVFLTLTFAENMQDLRLANYEFKKFNKRLNYYLGGKKAKLKYVAVPEFQDRGAVHYHVVYFNLPYIEANKIAAIWEKGFIKINAIDEVDNVGAYISKYMGKDISDKRLLGEKCYFKSRGLRMPTEIIENDQIESYLNSLPGHSKVFSNQFENRFLGKINYTQYNLRVQQKSVKK